MLRASSLGLSLLPPTTCVLRPCYSRNGFRIRLALLRRSLPALPLSMPASKVPQASTIHVGAGQYEHPPTHISQAGSDLIMDSLPSRQDLKAEMVGVLEDIPERNTIANVASNGETFAVDQDLPFNSSEILAASISVNQGESNSGKSRSRDPIKPLHIRKEEELLLRERLQVYQDKNREKNNLETASNPEHLDPDTQRLLYLRIIALTSFVGRAWEAYTALVEMQGYGQLDGERPPIIIPYAHLHRLCRLLARNRPKTRTQFLQLQSVLTMLRDTGGTIHLHEWNALIDHAGKGWRKTRTEDVKMALSIFNDMTQGHAPGDAMSRLASPTTDLDGQFLTPDTYTFTSLINIAARTGDGPAVLHTTKMLETAGLQPNRITHLSMLAYFTYNRLIYGVRTTLLKMNDQGLELGIDGLNACLWAYTNCNKPQTVKLVYRMLRHNIEPETYRGEDDVLAVAQQLKEDEHLVVADNMRPNEATFSLVIQSMAYHGDFLATVEAFMDMLSSENHEAKREPDGQLASYSPNFAVYRGIFLGFYKHAVNTRRHNTQNNFETISGDPTWTLDNLQIIYGTFIAWPDCIKASKSLIYWIMIAFERTSGNDVIIMRGVWTQLEEKFGIPLDKDNDRLRRLKTRIFAPDRGNAP